MTGIIAAFVVAWFFWTAWYSFRGEDYPGFFGFISAVVTVALGAVVVVALVFTGAL